METHETRKNTGRRTLAMGGLFGLAVMGWVLAGGFVSSDARGTHKVAPAASVETRTPAISDGSIQPGWASAENDVNDIQLD